MKLAALLPMLTGLILAPVWGATPAQACENCSCQGEGASQANEVVQALTGSWGSSPAVGPVVKSDGLQTVSKLAQTVSRRLGVSSLFGISPPMYWR
ncbi:MAG: hypothetical protein ACREOH_02930 [Candidatus Entotheonellia bacterium]